MNRDITQILLHKNQSNMDSSVIFQSHYSLKLEICEKFHLSGFEVIFYLTTVKKLFFCIQRRLIGCFWFW
jgi:hypothetical protein